jgi:hypothetical protein
LLEKKVSDETDKARALLAKKDKNGMWLWARLTTRCNDGHETQKAIWSSNTKIGRTN